MSGFSQRVYRKSIFGVTQRRKDAKGSRVSVHFFASLREASLNYGTPSQTGEVIAQVSADVLFQR